MNQSIILVISLKLNTLEFLTNKCNAALSLLKGDA